MLAAQQAHLMSASGPVAASKTSRRAGALSGGLFMMMSYADDSASVAQSPPLEDTSLRKAMTPSWGRAGLSMSSLGISFSSGDTCSLQRA